MPGLCYLVDGTALAYRSHFAFVRNPLTNEKGEETSATFGYTRALLDILRNDKPECIVVAFDVSRETFRKKRYPAYKATRDKAPAELKHQFDWIKEITTALGIPILELEGFEADDLIGTAAVRSAKAGYDVRIVSGDKDMMQLVNDRVKMLDIAARGGPSLIDADAVRDKFGVGPDRVIDVLGLMGDTSDNVPGVPLVGPKKATALVQQFGSLERVLEMAPSQKPSKTTQNLIDFAEQALLSKELVTIDLNVPIEWEMVPHEAQPRDRDALLRLFTALNFNQMLGEVGDSTAAEADAGGYRIVRGGSELKALVGELRDAGFFVFDTETTSLDPISAEIVGASVAIREGEGIYLPWNDEVATALKPLLEDPAVKKGAQNAKYDRAVLQENGIDVMGITFDTMLASYLLDPGRNNHNLDSMALRHLGIKKMPTEELIGKGKTQISMADVEEDKLARYAAEDADCTLRLVRFFEPQLEEMELRPLFDEVEMPLVPVLGDMERAGVGLDADYLKKISNELTDIAWDLAQEIQEIAGERFNLKSPKQLGPILFEKLDIAKGSKKRPRRTRNGSYSTDAKALEPYADLPIVSKLLEYREVTKLQSTYVDALPGMIHKKTGRIHSSFNQAVAATGRLSSNDPNLQNIPIRTELGRRIRKAFVAAPGHKLISADYSQIELRLMAHLSGDPALNEVYQNGGDIHTETASRMFGLKIDEVTRDQRGSAKAINFGILYGMGPQRLASDLKISMNEAREFLAAYFREFPGVKEFQNQAVETARREGFVMTLLGRRRSIPDINSGSPMLRANSENVAKNTPVQGTAADLIKVAMIRIHRRLIDEKLATKMILQVHDELVFEAPTAEVESVKALVCEEMERALDLAVPIVADVGVGDDWLEAH